MVRQFGIYGRGLSRDEIFAVRLYAATFYAQRGMTPTVAELCLARGITPDQARGCTYSISYTDIDRRLAS